PAPPGALPAHGRCFGGPGGGGSSGGDAARGRYAARTVFQPQRTHLAGGARSVGPCRSGGMISAIVQAAPLIILPALALPFRLLLKGCFVLRRQGRRSAVHTGNMLLRNPQVPEISVVVVAPASTPEVRALVQRLLNLYYRKHEVVLVLEMLERDFQAFCTEFGL